MSDDDDDVLEALRKRVDAAVFDTATPVRDFPPLARQLHGMLDEGDLVGLRRLRSRVLEVLEAAPVRELAALSRRVQLLTADIDALQATADDDDELKGATGTPDESWNGDPADL